jgi:hypothetical protein
MPQPEQLKQKKNIINQQHKKKKYKKNKDKYSEKVSTKRISTSAKKQNFPTKRNTERRHQQIPRKTQTKIKYPAETTANASKIPRQMSQFINRIR